MNARETFDGLIKEVTSAIAGRTLDRGLMEYLNSEYPAGGDVFELLKRACETGVAEGWLCEKENAGVKFSRPVKPGPETHGFSVDIVRMSDMRGPFHSHPNGEINMIMPLGGDAKFDGHGAGWWVYGPETAHYPTVSDGDALVLYLLPGGAIDFKATPKS